MYVGDIGVRGVCMYVGCTGGIKCLCVYIVCVLGVERWCEVCVCMLSVQGHGVYIVCCGLCASTTVHRTPGAEDRTIGDLAFSSGYSRARHLAWSPCPVGEALGLPSGLLSA